VGDSVLRFERDYEFSRVIVWDALIDADLVSGWLAEAVIVPVVGGEYTLRRLHQPEALGRISELQPLQRLEVEAGPLGVITFELDEFEGGSRGTSTRLRVEIALTIEPVFESRVKADWLTNLDQLEDLLRGHPVDWANWDRDRHESWTVHLEEVENSTA
jgi:uncharacterized protein YndB with AHSA1/START domain